jgi:hypothetical protein
MRVHQIWARLKKRRRPPTTPSNHRLPVAPYVLKREFQAEEPHQKWVTGMTHIRTAER